MSLLVTAWMFYRITGGLFNPAITVALWLVGVLTSRRAVILFIAQILGGIAGAALILGLTPTNSVQQVTTTLQPGISIAQGFSSRCFSPLILVFSVSCSLSKSIVRPISPPSVLVLQSWPTTFSVLSGPVAVSTLPDLSVLPLSHTRSTAITGSSKYTTLPIFVRQSTARQSVNTNVAPDISRFELHNLRT